MRFTLPSRTVRLETLLLCVMVSGWAAVSSAQDALRFVAVAPGISHASFDVYPPDSDAFSGHAFRIVLGDAELRLVPAGGPSPRQTVAQIASQFPAVVAVNASFFDTDGRAMGLSVSDGRLLTAAKRPSWGAFTLSGTDARIVLGSVIADPLAHQLVVQGLPRLVVGGRIPGLKPQVAERTAVCAAGNRVVIVVVTKAESTAFARLLAEPAEKNGLACPDALNLDGGPSTQLVVRLPGLSLSVPGGWGVPNALVAIPGKK